MSDVAAMKVNAAEDLVGATLPGGWRVVEKIRREAGDTGGNFSVCYLVVHDDGREGFCKVLNYHWLLSALSQGADPLEVMQHATTVYQFERDLARSCAGLSKVVTALDDGSFMVPGYVQGLVSYIIFERGERDIRRLLSASDQLGVSARLRALHNLASGVRQLHGRGVAHQDVKPSNALVFAPSLAGERVTKLADLGRASVRGGVAVHDELPIAGDPTYAPIEALYGAVPTEFGPRRLACDLYQLGSMVAFVFTGAHVNALLCTELHPSHRWQVWAGTFAEVMPYVRDAFERVVERVGESSPATIRDRVMSLVEQLCEPDPQRRGHRLDIKWGGNQYRLDRGVTELDLLSRRSAVGRTDVA